MNKSYNRSKQTTAKAIAIARAEAISSSLSHPNPGVVFKKKKETIFLIHQFIKLTYY